MKSTKREIPLKVNEGMFSNFWWIYNSSRQLQLHASSCIRDHSQLRYAIEIQQKLLYVFVQVFGNLYTVMVTKVIESRTINETSNNNSLDATRSYDE